MTTINPGVSITTNLALSPANLNNIVDQARLSGLTASPLISGLHFFNKARPGSPVDGDNNVDSTTGKIEFHDGSDWSFDRAEPLTVSLTNQHTETMTAGDVVVSDTANDDSANRI